MGFKWLRVEPVVGTRAMQNTKGTHVAVVMGQWRGKPDVLGPCSLRSVNVRVPSPLWAQGRLSHFFAPALPPPRKWRPFKGMDWI